MPRVLPYPATKCTPVLLFPAHSKSRKYGGPVREQVAQQQYLRQGYPNSQNRQPALQSFDLEEDESYYLPRSHTSARRYTVSPETVYQQGNKRLHVRYVDVPPRKSRQPQLPPQRERHTEEYGLEPQERVRPRRRFHPLVWAGVTLFIMVFGFVAFSSLSAWIQAKQDDLIYGQMRHFEVNAVVGHNDSSKSPSHFTAENNNGNIFVIELPGGSASKAKIFQITTIPGNDGNPPVRVTFQDVNHDGKPDMVVQIGKSNAMLSLILLNNGQTFVSRL